MLFYANPSSIFIGLYHDSFFTIKLSWFLSYAMKMVFYVILRNTTTFNEQPKCWWNFRVGDCSGGHIYGYSWWKFTIAESHPGLKRFETILVWKLLVQSHVIWALSLLSKLYEPGPAWLADVGGVGWYDPSGGTGDYFWKILSRSSLVHFPLGGFGTTWLTGIMWEKCKTLRVSS
jgi:hypothetical protein